MATAVSTIRTLLILLGVLFVSTAFDGEWPIKRNFLKIPTESVDFLYKHGAKKPVVLRIQQFNALADGLSALQSNLGMFSRANKDFLDWSVRKNQLLRELTHYDADIITLQECDHYYDFFLPELSQRGYVGYFAPKPTSACLEVSSNSDGCALFVKGTSLRVRSVETQTLALSVAELGDGGEVLEDDKSIKAQNQVAIIAICEIVGEGLQSGEVPPIIVSTTHLKSSKTTIGERYRQKGIQQILNQISKIYRRLESTGQSPAVLLAGDFNAEPYSSMGYGPMTYRAVKSHFLDFRSVYNDDIPLVISKVSHKDIYTNWKIRSDAAGGKERVVKRCIDYIFYSTYKAGVVKNSRSDLLQRGQRQRVTAVSTSQVAIAFFLRASVYLFGLLVPASALFSESLNSVERLVVFVLALLGFVGFEISSEGSIFKPRLDANLDTTKSAASSVELNSSEKILASVGRFSQRIEPLKLQQYGRPGFQVVQALNVYSEDQIGKDFLPSHMYPSDHISIAADLQILY